MPEHIMSQDCAARFAKGDTQMALQDQALKRVEKQVEEIHEAVVTGNGNTPPMGTRLSMVEAAVSRQWGAIILIIAAMLGAWIKNIYGRQ